MPRVAHLGPAARTAALTGALLLLGLGLLPSVLSSPAPFTSLVTVSWWQLAPIFSLAAVFVFHVEINSEAHTFSLSELPLVLGLFFASPRDLLLARLVGEAVTLVCVERQGAAKLSFNLSLFAAEGSLALTVFHALLPAGIEQGFSAWGAALAAVAAAAGLGVAAVSAVIRWHGGHVRTERLLLVAAVTALGNTSIAAVAGELLSVAPAALAPLGVVAAIVFIAYRGYTQLSKRYAGLELLYQFTRSTSGSTRPQETVASILDEARRMLRADTAAVQLLPVDGGPLLTFVRHGEGALDERTTPLPLPDDVLQRVVQQRATVVVPRTAKHPGDRRLLEALDLQDCLVAPVVSRDEVMGLLLVGDRLGHVSTFDGEDGRLFTTLSSQAGIALENGRLIDRLQEQVRAREHDSLHDALTGLPNRTLFARQVEEVLQAGAQHGVRLAILLMDLDRFKDVNDTLGHHTGDHLLQEVARRLEAAVQHRGLVARLGGDEFAVLLTGLADAADALATADELHGRVTEPVRLTSLQLEVGASIGVAVAPDHGDTLTTLLQRADVAMYACKGSRERVALYDPDTDWNSERRLRLAGELRDALELRQLSVHYQPIVRVGDGRVVKAEALVRWTHPNLGWLSPDEFIPVAERTGLIEDLTLYVLEETLRQLRRWRAAGFDVKVAVNLAVQVLLDVDWPGKVSALLQRCGVPPEALIFEITESGIMSDPDRMIRVLEEMADTGITFAIDDFGTGYSSLAYLQRLPIHEVKIDKSFVLPMTTDPAAASIVRSVIELARSLGLGVVAEGVEDQECLDALTSAQCDSVQGYHLARPQPGADFTAWLSTRAAMEGAVPAPVPHRA